MGAGESKPGDVGENATTQQGKMRMAQPEAGWRGLASELRQQMVGIHADNSAGENSDLSKKVNEVSSASLWPVDILLLTFVAITFDVNGAAYA